MDVLIADDNRENRDYLQDILEETTFNVVVGAENGVEAVHEYRYIEPDVVILALRMPECNGIKATAAIKKLNSNATVIIITPLVSLEEMKLAVEAGADGYVKEPFDADEVLSTVRYHCSIPTVATDVLNNPDTESTWIDRLHD